MGGFTLNIDRFVARGKKNPRLVAKQVVINCGSSIVYKTPVGDPDTWASPAPPGYVGGRARGSWQYAKGAPIEGEPGGVDASGAGAIGRVVAGVSSGDPADEHYITSNVPYMRELEYEGHSQQAPDGMVRETIAEFQQYVDQAILGLPR